MQAGGKNPLLYCQICASIYAAGGARLQAAFKLADDQIGKRNRVVPGIP